MFSIENYESKLLDTNNMNDLEKYFYNNNDKLIDKWLHYFNIYDIYFNKYKNKEEIVILEIGVFQGGSLQMWKSYFGPNAKIYGIDINPNCKSFEEKNIEIFIGSQSDRAFLRKIKQEIPKVDILIDDGGHKMNQQIIAFEELFDHVKEDGIYLCEDTHSSYQIMYGGGHKRYGTFIEYSKNFIDYINAYFSEQSSLKVNKYTKSIKAIHFYDSIVVFEKGKRDKPQRLTTGKATVQNYYLEPTGLKKVRWIVKKNVLVTINKGLRFFRIKNFF
jgi:23S rRNA U2552 (ribose-2'-O)-methylase RlmE/FtsJ